MGETPALEAELTVRVGSFEVQSSLRLEEGLLVFFGPSGAGKSLTLRAVAGLVRPVAGFIRVRGETLFDAARGIDVPAHKRRLGYVPQDSALLPFRTVAENVRFGLPRAERRSGGAKFDALMRELGLQELAGAYPPRLSGGERQRVALARALAVEPQLLLLDEPLAALDHSARNQLRNTLRASLTRHGIPAAFVTHDPQEALSLADRVVRFARGRTVASGPAGEVLAEHVPLTLSLTAAAHAGAPEQGMSRLQLTEAALRGPTARLEALAEKGPGALQIRVLETEREDG